METYALKLYVLQTIDVRSFFAHQKETKSCLCAVGECVGAVEMFKLHNRP